MAKKQSKKAVVVPPMKVMGNGVVEKVKSLMSGMHTEKVSKKKLNKKGVIK